MAKRKTNNKKQTKQTRKMNKDTAIVILIIAGLLSGVLIYFKSGYIGEYLSNLLGGVFGIVKYILPIGIFAVVISLVRNSEGYVMSERVQYGIIVCCICTVLSIYEVAISRSLVMTEPIKQVTEKAFYLGTINKGGGVVGAIVSYPLVKLLGIAGTVILTIGLALVFIVFMFGFKPTELIANLLDKIKKNAEQNENDKIENNNEGVETKKERRLREKEEKRRQAEEVTQLQINFGEELGNLK